MDVRGINSKMGMYKYKGIKLWRGMYECTGKLS